MNEREHGHCIPQLNDSCVLVYNDAICCFHVNGGEKDCVTEVPSGGGGRGAENDGFGSHTCGGLFAFGNKERNDKRKARARSRRPGAGCERTRKSGGLKEEGVAPPRGRGSLREQWRNNVQIAVSDAPSETQVSYLCADLAPIVLT